MPGKFSIKYYHDLYLIQDEVLGLIDGLGFGFYLGGGTALSRFYLDHRYSDDVDLFSPNDQDFETHIQKGCRIKPISNELKKAKTNKEPSNEEKNSHNPMAWGTYKARF